MNKIFSACRLVRGAITRAYSMSRAVVVRSISRIFHRIFNTRPGLKRGVLVFCMFAVLALPLTVMAPSGAALSSVWALTLFALFLGMGAERAAIEWSPVFALPPIGAFAFWRWHALEKKRFLAVIAALILGVVSVVVFGHFT